MTAPKHTTEVLCADCGQLSSHGGRHLCFTCYARNDYYGTLDQYPPLRTWLSTAARVEDYAELRRQQYMSLRDAAARLGVSERTAWRYEAKLRAVSA
ncbi:XRE family transcriptional regulator [Nonomuraea terrae]|uniref:XRE family transcriptional regulator n=1 Tax=Nonomuraea terrae TaxID=2530383 RepID=A0A4R4YKD0_9ACTN|nr:helix-turn-helix transcriptional regulator [Nonomuraea terrae]TDD45415.1 XRE family transcriptional regulator [Nonomuraea terrae]